MFQKTCIFRNIIHYQIEQGSDWVVSCIWSQVSSRLDMQLHNEHCQELVLSTENQLMRAVIAYTERGLQSPVFTIPLFGTEETVRGVCVFQMEKSK